MTIERRALDTAFLLECIYRNGRTLACDPPMPAAARRILADTHADFCVKLAAELGLRWDENTRRMLPLS